jgi:hypothetical protein
MDFEFDFGADLLSINLSENIPSSTSYISVTTYYTFLADELELALISRDLWP